MRPDTDTDTDGGYVTQESLQTLVRQALDDHTDHNPRVAAGPIDHHTQAQQRWVTDGGTSADDRRWTL